MKTIMVTGGAGFIGSHLCERLLSEKNKVVCIDNFNDYYDPLLKEQNIKECLKNDNFELWRVDIRNKKLVEEVFKKNKIEIVIHLAARAGVRPSLINPEIYFETNVDGTKNLLELAIDFKVEKFIFGSSSSVYGINKKVPFSENDKVDIQISPYAKTKRQAELLCEEFSKKYNLKIIALRFFTVYGPRGRLDMAPYKFVDLIFNGKPIDIYVNETDFNAGKMARDFTYILDIIDGIVLSSKKEMKEINFEIINLGRGSPVNLDTFVKIIEQLLGKKSIKNFIGPQEGDVPITYADISKAKNFLRYQPKISIEEGMKHFVEWYLGQKKKVKK